MLAVLGCALGLPQMSPKKPSSVAAAAKPAGAPSSGALSKRQGIPPPGFGGGFGGGSQFRSGGQAPQERNWGPKAWGPGLNNPWAFPVNPFVMQRAVALTERCPGTLARVGVDGEVIITDQQGWEVEILDMFGNELSDSIDEFDFESSFLFGGAPGFGGASGFGIPPPGFGGAAGMGAGSAGMGGSPGAAGRSSFGQSPCFKRPKFGGFFEF